MKRRDRLSAIILIMLALSVSCGGGGSGGSNSNSTGTSSATITGSALPSVIAKSTDGSSCAVDTGSAISVVFNKDMDAPSISTATFTLGGVSGAVTYNSSTKTATLTPSIALEPGTGYTATVTTGVKDSASNALPVNYTWAFTTKQAAAVTGTSRLMGGAIQGIPLNPATNIVTTLAGAANSIGSADATGTAAKFNFFIHCL